MAERFESFLTADLGSITTRVSLIDRVAGEYRLLARGEAPTSSLPPWEDISIGVREAMSKVEAATGRQIWSERGPITPERGEGNGVDGLVAVTSTMEPLHLAVVGLARPWSVETGLRAARSTYTFVEAVLTAPQLRLSRGVKELRSLLSQGKLEAIIITGGTNERPTDPLVEMTKDMVLLLTDLGEGGLPFLIFAGNERAQASVAQVLEGVVQLRVVENLMPTLGSENLAATREALEELLAEKIDLVPGMAALSTRSMAPIQPAAKALGWAVDYLAQEYGLRLLAVDLGGSTTTLISMGEGSHACALTSDMGTGYGVENLLERAGVEKIVRWLPFDLEGTENRILNKGLRPSILPQRKEDLLLEEAVARELVRWGGRSLLEGETWTGVDLIVATGGFFSHLPDPRQAALLLLDSLQPAGVYNLALDELSLLPQIGALAQVEPLAAAQLLTKDALLSLGTVIAPLGKGKEGEIALRFKIGYPEGGSIEGEVSYGSLEVIPLPLGQRATLEVRPSPNFDLGLGSKGLGATAEVEGSALGVIIDARGRPLSLPEEREARQRKIQEWMWEIGL